MDCCVKQLSSSTLVVRFYSMTGKLNMKCLTVLLSGREAFITLSVDGKKQRAETFSHLSKRQGSQGLVYTTNAYAI